MQERTEAFAGHLPRWSPISKQDNCVFGVETLSHQEQDQKAQSDDLTFPPSKLYPV
jgi:hypothetical protein